MNRDKVVRAGEVMNEELILIDGIATAKEALGAVRDKGARCIVVKKRHEDDEYGILLLSEIAKKVIAAKRLPISAGIRSPSVTRLSF